jgi:hypothetical protein
MSAESELLLKLSNENSKLFEGTRLGVRENPCPFWANEGAIWRIMTTVGWLGDSNNWSLTVGNRIASGSKPGRASSEVFWQKSAEVTMY